MLKLSLPLKIEKALTLLAKRTGKTKNYYVRLAIEGFLENYQDYLIAEDRIRHAMLFIALDEVIRKSKLSFLKFMQSSPLATLKGKKLCLIRNKTSKMRTVDL